MFRGKKDPPKVKPPKVIPPGCRWQRLYGGGQSWLYLMRDGDPKCYGARWDG